MNFQASLTVKYDFVIDWNWRGWVGNALFSFWHNFWIAMGPISLVPCILLVKRVFEKTTNLLAIAVLVEICSLFLTASAFPQPYELTLPLHFF